MSTEKSDPSVEESTAPSSESEAGPTEPESGDKPPQANWEFRKEFRINTKMREILNLTKQVTESEIDRLRRKVEKLTYGS